MTLFLKRHVAPEILGLFAVELALAFIMACAFLTPAGVGSLRLVGMVQAAIIAVFVVFVSFVLGTYRPQRLSGARGVLVITAAGAAVAVAVIWGSVRLLPAWLPGLGRSLGGSLGGSLPTWPVLAWLVTLLLIRLAFLAGVRCGLFVRRVAVLGPPSEVKATLAAIGSDRTGFFEVVEAPMVVSDPAALRRIGVAHVLTTPDRRASLSDADRDRFTAAGVELTVEAEFWARHLKRIFVARLTPQWFESLDRNPVGRMQLGINRVGDVAISLGLLLFTLPLMALVTLAVRLESPGPVLYRQERVGLNGVSFVVLKFRSMKVNAETRGPAWAQAGDPRVTRIGLLMRRTRIDELPQLVNVLRGEMSFIGPRPERPHFVEQLAEVIPFYRERSRVKPGLTGWAQVNYPYGASVEDAEAKLSYDLYYVRNRSVWLDLATLFATVRVIVFQEGSR